MPEILKLYRVKPDGAFRAYLYEDKAAAQAKGHKAGEWGSNATVEECLGIKHEGKIHILRRTDDIFIPADKSDKLSQALAKLTEEELEILKKDFRNGEY